MRGTPGDPSYRQDLAELAGDPRIIFLVGFDHCIAGIGRCYGHVPRVIYDTSRVLAELIRRGQTPTQATQTFERHIQQYCGPYTPIFLDRVSQDHKQN